MYFKHKAIKSYFKVFTPSNPERQVGGRGRKRGIKSQT
jgi:hypothetical protein